MGRSESHIVYPQAGVRVRYGAGAEAEKKRAVPVCEQVMQAGRGIRTTQARETKGGAENGDACDTGCRRGRPSASISVFIAKWTICLNPSVAIYNSTKHIGRSDKPT
jgi:hypothetical protein